MPEFILDTSGVVQEEGELAKSAILARHPQRCATCWDDLDAFTQGYIEALFFTSNSPAWSASQIEADPEGWREAEREGQSDGTLPGDAGFSDLAPEDLAEIVADCAKFQFKNSALLQEAYGHHFPPRVIGDGTLPDSHRPAWDYDEAAAGRDFWFTRVGHGVGFWDRGLGDVGDRLSERCDRVEINPYWGEDGKVRLG